MLLLPGVTIGAGGGAWDIAVRGLHIESVVPARGEPAWVCLPPLADLHVHANRAFTPPAQPPVGLDDAVRSVDTLFRSFTVERYARHAALLFEAAARRGTTRVRTHADLHDRSGLDAVAGSLRAAGDYSGRVDVEVVAFASASLDPASDQGGASLREAVAMGARYLGAVPAFCEDPRASIDALLDLAIELSLPVDLHLDEHLEPARSMSGYLARATIERGLEGRVTLGHGCAIAALPAAERSRVVTALAEAGITVIVLPRTNLYLQDASGSMPVFRGLAPVRELCDAGVAVRFASDNVRDAFYPFGDADLLGVAMDAVLGTQIRDLDRVVAAICDGSTDLAVGDSSDMVILEGASFDEILSAPPRRRFVLRGGVLSEAGD